MKLLIRAAIASTVLTSAAFAQTTTNTTTPSAAPIPPSACASLQQPPALPDGATATREQMRAGEQTYRAWVADYETSMQCRRREVEAHRIVTEQVEAVDAAMRDQFNAQADVQNTVSRQWRQSGATFNARPPRSTR